MNYTLQIKPLSVNEAFKGKKYKTDKYDRFIHNMMLLLPYRITIPNRSNIKLAIQFGFSSKASDIDNCLKSFIDCLVKKYGCDDRHIYEIHVFKEIVPKGKEFIKFKIY